jgi:hypothetical protein
MDFGSFSLRVHPSIDSDNEAPSTKTRTDSGLRSDRKISNDIEKCRLISFYLTGAQSQSVFLLTVPRCHCRWTDGMQAPTPDSERKAPEIHIEPVPEDEPETPAQDWPSTQLDFGSFSLRVGSWRHLRLLFLLNELFDVV